MNLEWMKKGAIAVYDNPKSMRHGERCIIEASPTLRHCGNPVVKTSMFDSAEFAYLFLPDGYKRVAIPGDLLEKHKEAIECARWNILTSEHANTALVALADALAGVFESDVPLTEDELQKEARDFLLVHIGQDSDQLMKTKYSEKYTEKLRELVGELRYKLDRLEAVLNPVIKAARERFIDKDRGYPINCPFCGESSQLVSSISRGTYAECAAYEMDKPCPIKPRTPYLTEAQDGLDECTHVWNHRPEQEQTDKALLKAGKILASEVINNEPN